MILVPAIDLIEHIGPGPDELVHAGLGEFFSDQSREQASTGNMPIKQRQLAIIAILEDETNLSRSGFLNGGDPLDLATLDRTVGHIHATIQL